MRWYAGCCGGRRGLNLSLDVAVVSKNLLSWTTEAGFGAVGFDGAVWINQQFVVSYKLDQPTIKQQTQAALTKVKRRLKLFRGDRPWPDLQNRPVIVVDDGIAAGSTISVALQALRNSGAVEIIVAVPTAHKESLIQIMNGGNALYCANIHRGLEFAIKNKSSVGLSIGMFCLLPFSNLPRTEY